MKGFKAFEKGMICRGKQYKENTVFEEDKAIICSSGMHFCENPLDVLDYYPLVDSNGNMVEVAEVETLDECKTDDNKKYCTKKLKIGFKLSLSAFVKAAIEFAFEKTTAKRQQAIAYRWRAQAMAYRWRAQANTHSWRAQAMAYRWRAQAMAQSLRVQAMARLLPELENGIQQRGRKAVG